MERVLRSALVAIAAACLPAMLGAASASAQAPAISVDANDVSHVLFVTPPILDFSRSQLMSDSGIEYVLEVEQDAQGRIQGTGRDTDGAGFDVQHVVKGKCKTARGLPALREKMTSSGALGSGDSGEYKAVGLVRGLVQGWGGQAQLVGTLRSRVCITQPGLNGKPFRHCVKNTVPYTQNLPDVGDWEIDVALERSGSRVFGAASITTAVLLPSMARTFEVSVEGRVAADGKAVVDLRPLGPDGLGSVRLEATLANTDPPTIVSIQGVRGKILGQRFNEAY